MGVSSQGILTPLPPDFAFPRMNMNGLITKWLLGDKKSNIPPLRLINANPNFIAHVKNGKRVSNGEGDDSGCLAVGFGW